MNMQLKKKKKKIKYLPDSFEDVGWETVQCTQRRLKPHDPFLLYCNYHQEKDQQAPSYHFYQAKAWPKTGMEIEKVA